MSNPLQFHRHPDYEELLGAVDTDAPAPNRGVRRHVKNCWKCQSRIEEMQNAVIEFARYQERHVLPNVPPPPREWLDLRLAMRQWDQANPTVSIWSRLRWARIGVPGALACAALAYVASFEWRKPEPSRIAPTVAVSAPRTESSGVSESKTAPPAAPVVAPRPRAAQHEISTNAADVEVRVLAALHEIGADLGDPIEVASGPDGNVHVRGIGIAEDRQAEIRQALSSEPGLVIGFENTVSDAPTTKSISLGTSRNPFEARLMEIAGGPAALERLTNRVLDESDSVLARGHAIHNLLARFPASRRERLHDRERAVLDNLLEEHARQYKTHAATLLGLMEPVRRSLKAPAAVEDSASDRLEAARRMDRVVSVIFGVAPTKLTDDELLVELSAACHDLGIAAGARE